MSGKTIQIFLPTGNPKEVKKASITTEKIEIIQVPRSQLPENKNLLDFNGVYLLADNLKSEKPEIYIGKGDVKSRVTSHDANKDFWTTLFAIKLKDISGFNDAHNSYLEYYFINKAKKINQSINEENKQIPTKPNLTEETVAELEDYITTIETLLSTLGLKCFQPQESGDRQKQIFYCSDKYGNSGTGEYTEEGFLLYKGAICKKELHQGTDYVSKRNELIIQGLLKDNGSSYILTENKLFSSVSTAAAIVLGRRSNGWTEWKDADGKTLDEIERR
jgi:hypothetical protein